MSQNLLFVDGRARPSRLVLAVLVLAVAVLLGCAASTTGPEVDSRIPPDPPPTVRAPELPIHRPASRLDGIEGEAAGDWRPWAARVEGSVDHAIDFVPTAQGGWRCFGARCEVLTSGGRPSRSHDFPCSGVGFDLFTSPRRVFAGTTCGDDFIIVSMENGSRRTVRLPQVDIRTVVVDDDGTATLSVLPHGELIRLRRDGTTKRLSVVAPPNRYNPKVPTFISAAHAPWLAFTAGAAGGEQLWTRAAPGRAWQASDDLFFNGSLCWTVSTQGDVWRVRHDGTMKVLATKLRTDKPRTSAGPWGLTGFAFVYGLEEVELRGPDLELRERVELPAMGRFESSPAGDRLFLVRSDGSIDIRTVQPPDAPH